MSSSDSSFSVENCQLAPGAKSQHYEERTLLLGLLLGLLGSTTGSGGSTTSRRGGSRATRADVQQKLLDVLALKRLSSCQNYHRIQNPRLLRAAYLGEQRRPDGLDIGDLSGGDQSLELVGLRCD